MSADFVFEHLAFNVPDREKVERWYEKNLGLKIVRAVPGKMSFLADPSGRVVFELYSNPDGPVLDFANEHFLAVHIAFLVADPESASRKLVAAGATIADPIKNVNGDVMVMLKDPFGISIQLMKRATPMFQL